MYILYRLTMIYAFNNIDFLTNYYYPYRPQPISRRACTSPLLKPY